jgi:hypothetical protein
VSSTGHPTPDRGSAPADRNVPPDGTVPADHAHPADHALPADRSTPARRPTPPPLEANDQLVTGGITVGWVIALIVLLVVRTQIPPSDRWWIWTCVGGVGFGVFGLLYVPRLKRSRARAAERREQAPH